MFPLVGVRLGVVRFLPPLLALPLPHLLAELVHAVQVGVVDEGHEVPVPHLLAGRVAGRSVPRPGAVARLLALVQQVLQMVGVDDLQRDLEQRLDEAVLHRVAVVDPRVLPVEASDQQALLRPYEPVLGLHLP